MISKPQIDAAISKKIADMQELNELLDRFLVRYGEKEEKHGN